MIPNVGSHYAAHTSFARPVPLAAAAPLRPQDIVTLPETRRAVLAAERAGEGNSPVLRDIPATLQPPDPDAPAGPPPAFDSTPLEQLRKPVDEIATALNPDAGSHDTWGATDGVQSDDATQLHGTNAQSEHIDLIR